MITITGYFKSIYGAQKAYNDLKKQGFKNARMDIIDRFPKNADKRIDNVIGSREGSLSSLILKPGEGEISMELRSLYAADPNVSGMGGFSEVADANILVSTTVEDGDEERCKRIIQENDGEV
ncbi:hypothetical protein HNQ80_003073 [Anaerosolibacter carboniphilus]|uniref:Uncharacterized protein n=1 Tax=Anaerosolibacter carboniphilus TaxID=1417629 RepID=A0A841KXI0_9FIRM|nr:hypothetical protein [Anaerosolibacter carboniphilus]MBB6216968.1 hypothetical protein [Anaerosolibacter carboniphilus]